MKIHILSRGPQLYSTQSLFRAGMRRGHLMRIVDYTRSQLYMEKNNFYILQNGHRLETPDAIIPRIGSSATTQGAALISHYEALGAITPLRSTALLQARDKLRCLQKLASNGIDIPHTAYPSNSENLDKLIHQLGGLPIVIKLLESTHGMGVILADNLHSVSSTVEAFQRLKEQVILQEFIKEAKGADIRALVVAGKVVAAMKRQAKKGEFRSNLHRGASASIFKLSAQENDLVIRSTQVMGLDMAGVDLLQSTRGPLLMEVNASPGLEGIETTTGIDVAGKLIKHLERRFALRREQKAIEK